MRSMRKFVFALFLMLAVTFIMARTAEVSSIIDTLKEADWRFIALAIMIMGAWLLNTALCYWAIYRAMDMEEKLGHLALIAAGAYFVNVVAPTAGVGGIAVFAAEAKRKGISRARVMVATAVVVLLDYIGFMIMLALGLVVLFRRSSISTTELVATAIMVTFITVLGSLLYKGMQSAEALGNTLAAMARRVNRLFWPFLHREYIAEYRAYEFAHDASGGLHRLRYQPKGLLLPAIFAFTGKLLLVLIFMVTFLAFKVPFSTGTIVGGWSISYLFTIVSPTPGGMGVVEGLLPLSLATLNVPLGAATVITLMYRGITFWLPLLVGMLALRWLVRDEKAQAFA